MPSVRATIHLPVRTAKDFAFYRALLWCAGRTDDPMIHMSFIEYRIWACGRYRPMVPKVIDALRLGDQDPVDERPDDATREAVVSALAAIVLAEPYVPWRFPETKTERSRFVWAALELDLARVCADDRLRFTLEGWRKWNPDEATATAFIDMNPSAAPDLDVV
ncbi:MAG: hypothetical protein AcusKO_01230 [Acuticoccus sp.]